MHGCPPARGLRDMDSRHSAFACSHARAMNGCPPARGLRDRGYENPDILIMLISASRRLTRSWRTLPAGARRATLARATLGGLTSAAVTDVCHRRSAN